MAETFPRGELLLCRHGETDWSRAGRHTGRTEVPLTAAGREQAERIGALLVEHRPVHVLCSPRQRALDTARRAGYPDPTVLPELAEWDYGDYEGLTTEQIRADRPGWTIWTGDPPGGETAVEVGERADRLLARITVLRGDGDVLAVGHGHFGRVLAARYLGLPVAAGALLRLDPACLCVLGHEHESPAVTRWNVPARGAR